MRRNPVDLPLLFEVSWRCGATMMAAAWITKVLLEQEVEPHWVGMLRWGGWGDNLPFENLAEVLHAMIQCGHHVIVSSILNHRMKKAPSEVNQWESLALTLVMNSELIRGSEMENFYWKEIASKLVTKHARQIASAIFREQADRTDKISRTWFVKHSHASEILHRCVEVDPKGVWEEIRPFLSDPKTAYRFTIGFPHGIIERLPTDDVDLWIEEYPEERVELVARLVNKDLSGDQTMMARLIGKYSDKEEITNAFFSVFASGSWTGPASTHWTGLAGFLKDVAQKTSLPKLRRWAGDSAHEFERMAERDSKREEEEFLRGR